MELLDRIPVPEGFTGTPFFFSRPLRAGEPSKFVPCTIGLDGRVTPIAETERGADPAVAEPEKHA